ncbi:uncharacterized protein LOC144063755 isoform X1 [Vanacampus margaritifer]
MFDDLYQVKLKLSSVCLATTCLYDLPITPGHATGGWSPEASPPRLGLKHPPTSEKVCGVDDVSENCLHPAHQVPEFPDNDEEDLTPLHEEDNFTKLPLTGDLSAKPPGICSSQRMTTEVYREPCGGSQADSLFASVLHSGDTTTSHFPETDDEQSDGDMTCHTFVSQSLLKTHITVHIRETPFACVDCGKRFSQKANLTTHTRTHTGEKPFLCSFCDQRFSTKGNLKTHIRKHTGEIPFSCSFCKQQFSTKGNLNTHIRTHTGEKPFSCSFCDQQFSTNGNLKTHIRTHTGEKPFVCIFCNQQFSTKGNLDAHIRTHTGEKPFACFFCDKQFSTKGNLMTHTKTHTGEKPFACSFCGQIFSQKGNLSHHIRSAHSGK